ncbi:cation transporter [bacterium]|nr:cation transporter [bacterium]
MNHTDKAIKTTGLSLIANIFLAIVKLVTGVFGNSFALIADAIESTADVFASILVLLGIKYAAKPADENHPYGHGKAEPLITFVIVGFLLASAVVIAYQAIINIQTPHKSPKAYTLLVLGLIIIIKEIFYRIISKRSKQTHSSALEADAWHHRSDAITSFMAFVGISISLYFGDGYESADDWAALLASGIIVYNAFLILRPALGEVMDEHRYDELINEVRSISETVKGVVGTEKCFVRKLGFEYHIDLHLIVNGDISVKAGHLIAHQVKEKLQEENPQIADVHIHVEPHEF